MNKVLYLNNKLIEAGLPVCGVSDNGDNTFRVDFQDSATEDQKKQAYDLINSIDFEKVEKEEKYKVEVVSRIRAKYSLDDEIAIQRKHQAGLDNGEFETYNNYAEEVKAAVKAELNI